ncbi:MAG: ATP-binding protein [Clostridia bacterium]|nr:ATP-binding protein [Clostridia bacterium]
MPCCPVIYLGLSRLIPYGEYNNDEAVSSIKKNLPESFIEAVAKNYKDFTGLGITYKDLQRMGDIKSRSEFISDVEGIDSNTISAGEDNLYIILMALESLKLYYEAIESRRDVESVLLIDELDATLHPDYQIRLLKLLRDYLDFPIETY